MLHISKSTLYELTRRGEINFYRVGRNIRFSEEDIEAYLLRSHQRQESFVKKNFAEPKLMFSPSPEPDSIVLCGQDIILDVLSNYMRPQRRSDAQSLYRQLRQPALLIQR